MASDVWGSRAVSEARARMSRESASHARSRRDARRLWDAALALASQDAALGDTLRARAVLHRDGVITALHELGGDPSLPPQQAWAALSASVRGPLVGRGEHLAVFEPVLESGLEKVPEEQWALAAEAMRDAHERALKLLEADQLAVERVMRRRWIIAGFAAVLVAAIVLVVRQVERIHATPYDIAEGLPFTLSSQWKECHPEREECGHFKTRAKFITLEEASPWYQVDLGQPTKFSRFTIVNRQDLAIERAVPLVIEVSDDAKTFKVVARQEEVFIEWAPIIEPVTARYVRVRVDRFSLLHLEAVRVHP